MSRRYAIIEAPSALGSQLSGVEHAPQALLEAGLATRLNARLAGRVDPAPYDSVRDFNTGFLNPRGVASYARSLAPLVERAVRHQEFPVVLGGDCSILLGAALALRGLGRYGLLFIDGHSDFYEAMRTPDGAIA